MLLSCCPIPSSLAPPRPCVCVRSALLLSLLPGGEGGASVVVLSLRSRFFFAEGACMCVCVWGGLCDFFRFFCKVWAIRCCLLPLCAPLQYTRLYASVRGQLLCAPLLPRPASLPRVFYVYFACFRGLLLVSTISIFLFPFSVWPLHSACSLVTTAQQFIWL